MKRAGPASACAALWLCGACAYKVIEDGRLEPAALGQLVDSVAEIRGLAPTRPLRVSLEGPEKLRRRAEQDARSWRRQQELERQQLIWAKLGLIAPDDDLAAAYAQWTREAPYGYYDDADQILRVVARPMMRSEVLELVSALRGRDVVAGEILSHEVCHALQDMHFGLRRLEDAAPSDDAALALRALVEGDASLVGFLYAATFFQDFETWVRFLDRRARGAFTVDEVPPYLSARLQFPYIEGGLFVAALYRDGGFSAVDAAFRAPPSSTEVVLHPERRDQAAGRPRQIALPPQGQVAAGTINLGEDTLGELGLRLALRRNLPGCDAARIADGWGGDRYRVTQEPQGRLGLEWATRWDSAADAAEFCQAYLAWVARSYHGSRARRAGTTTRFDQGGETVAAVDCAGDAVDIVETLPGEGLERSLQALVDSRGGGS